jgi:Flp pilus assembly secretin CpaC
VKQLFYIFMFQFVACLTVNAQSSGETWHFSIGEQRSVRIPGIRRIAQGNARVINVKSVAGRMLVVQAKGIGTSDLSIWTKSGIRKISVVVARRSVMTVFREVEKMIAPLEGIRIVNAGSRLVLTGTAHRVADFRFIREICRSYPSIKRMVRLSRLATRVACRQLNRTFQNAGIRSIHAQCTQGNVLLSGIGNEWQRVLARTHARKTGLRTTDQIEKIESVEKAIQLHVEFLEVSRQWHRKTGIHWQTVSANVLDMQRLLHGDAGRFRGSLGAFIESRGIGRVIAKPALAGMTGSTATFLAGGELPFRIVTEKSDSVRWHPYGVSLSVRPEMKASGNVMVSLEASLSSPDTGHTIMGYPAFRKRRVQTSFQYDPGKIVILSGLVQSRDSRQAEGLPFFSSLPVLGKLFQSASFQNQQTELIIAVTSAPEFPKDRLHHLKTMKLETK